LYWDSEMFKHSTKVRKELEKPKDYKAEVFKLLQNPKKNFFMKGSLHNANHIIKMLIKYGLIIENNEKVYKTIYECLIAGDPKSRTLRAIITNITMTYSQKYDVRSKKKNGK